MINTLKTAALILYILIIAFFAPIPQQRAQAIPQEPARAVEGEIVEGRSVIVNVPGKRGYTFILEV